MSVEEHSNSQSHIKYNGKKYLNIACQYADDIIHVTTNKAENTGNYSNIPIIQLEEHNPGEKTPEDYKISMKET